MAVSGARGARSSARKLAYSVFGRLPPRVRRVLVGVISPSFTVGALAVIHDGGRLLFVTQLHRPGLALPGGLLKKGESARSALARELREELGLDAAGFAGTPDTAHVDPAKTRVDLIFFLAADSSSLSPKVDSEILSYQWRSPDDVDLTPQTKEIITAIVDRIPK